MNEPTHLLIVVKKEAVLDFSGWNKEDLIKLIEMHAHNWLAHDGCWFLAAENKYGMDAAMELDAKSWERFTVAEATRIMRTFDLPKQGGLDVLEKALGFRLYATVNEQSLVREQGKIVYKMLSCRVQAARERKNLDFFPCKSVGIVEYTGFARTIDPRIQTRCIGCPPDPVQGAHCIWEFTLDQ